MSPKPLIHATMVARLPSGEPPLPRPTAQAFAAYAPRDINDNDVFATATPLERGSMPYIDSQPLFFRTVVPPILVDFPKKGEVTRFADSPELRALCEAELRTLHDRFAPARSIAQAQAVTAPRLPTLEAAVKTVPQDTFEGWDLIAVQHLYASTVSLVDALAECGLDHRRATIIGKPYSTHYPAARALVDRGASVPPDSLEQVALEEHDAAMERAIRAQLDAYAEKVARGEGGKGLLVLDDGGQLIEAVHRHHPELLDHVVCVEQTTRGLRRVERLPELGAPVVKAADAPLKLDNEMPLVGLSACYEVLRKLRHLESCGIEPGKVISINGVGNVGREVLRAMRLAGYQIRIYDPAFGEADLEALAAAGIDGVEWVRDRDRFLEGANVLVSATGAAPITLEDYRRLPDRAVLFNAASSNDELDASRAIAAARHEQPPRDWWAPEAADNKAAYVDGLPDLLADREYVLPSTGWLWGELGDAVIPLGHVARGAQRDRVLHFADKDIYLAKSGFVVNLTDEEDPIPARYIQPTRAALFLACAQAVRNVGDNRLHDLEPEGQRIAQAAYDAELGPDRHEVRWLPEWVTRPPVVTRFEGTPTIPPALETVVEGIVFPSPGHVLAHGASEGPKPD